MVIKFNIDFLNILETRFNISKVDELATLTEFPRSMTSQTSHVVKEEIHNIIRSLTDSTK